MNQLATIAHDIYKTLRRAERLQRKGNPMRELWAQQAAERIADLMVLGKGRDKHRAMLDQIAEIILERFDNRISGLRRIIEQLRDEVDHWHTAFNAGKVQRDRMEEALRDLEGKYEALRRNHAEIDELEHRSEASRFGSDESFQ